MHRRIQISGGLLATLITLFCEVSQVLYLANTLVKSAGQEAWLALLLGNGAGALVGLLGVAVCLRHPGLAPAQIARQVLGKWLGGLVGLLYGGFFLWIYALVLRDLLDFTHVVLLTDTPGLVLVTLVALGVLSVTWAGLEPIARVAAAILILSALSVGLIPVLLLREMSIRQVEPFLYHGMPSVLKGALCAMPWFVESLIVMSLVPYLKQGVRAFRWFLVGAAGATLILLILMVTTTLVLGPDLPARFTYPVFIVVQQITLGRTIERIEVILVAVWMSGTLIKLALCLYATASSWAQVLGSSQRYRPALILATVAGLLLTYLWHSSLDVMHMTREPLWIFTTLLVTAGLPLLMLAGSLVRAVGERRRSRHA